MVAGEADTKSLQGVPANRERLLKSIFTTGTISTSPSYIDTNLPASVDTIMTADVEKKFAEEHDHEHGECCDHDHDEHDHSGSEADDNEGDAQILNRNEKKARKLFSKMGLKPVPGIERVAIKRGRMIFAIANPTVYHTPSGYVVFGEAKVEDPTLQAQAMAAQRLAQAQRPQEETNETGKEKVEIVEDDGEEIDLEGVDDKDVRIVMEQTNVSRSKAVKALKANNNDIVNTIMELTM